MVMTETNRPDLVAETNQAVFEATLSAHSSDFYYKDILQAQMTFNTTDYFQTVDTTTLTNFRSFAFFRKAVPGPTLYAPFDGSVSNPLPPITNNPTTLPQVTYAFLDKIEPDDIVDGYGYDKFDVWYQAGTSINVKSSTSLSNAQIGWYAYPELDIADLGTAFSSWIANELPYVIVYKAAASVMQKIGQTEAIQAYMNPNNGLYFQQLQLLKMDCWFLNNTSSGGNITASSTYSIVQASSSQLKLVFDATASSCILYQRVEANRVADLVTGTSITISGYIQVDSLATTPTLNYQLNAANALNNFGASTSVGGGTLPITLVAASLVYFEVTLTIGGNAYNGLEFVIIVGNATNRTLEFTLLQLEANAFQTPSERKFYPEALLECQRVNLNSAIFPFYTEAAGRTIIVPEYDENWDRNNAANTSPEKGVPQVYYMHNVMPKAGGFQSVGYNVVLSQFGPPSVTNFDQAFSLQSTDNSNVLFVPASGVNYVYDAQVGNYWVSVSPITGSSILTSQTAVTTAFINGQTYFCYAGYGTFYYNTSTKLMVRVVWVNGILNDATILGITASNGYMIAWTKTALFWSSLVNPLDFTPSIQTGAGGGALQYARGNINFCLPIGGGFIVYCDKNAVGSSYTNNSQYPWIFQEITDSGGCFDPNQVAAGINLDTHYAMTTNGLQGINRTQAQSVFPEVTDFLSLRLFEDFSNGVFSESLLGAPLYTKLAAVENRFLVFSYGQTQAAFTHAIVFDLTLGRNNSQILLSNDDPTAILSGNIHRFYCQSTENVAFGALVNLYNFGGALRARTADATDNTKPAIGFASQPGGIPNGQIGEVCLVDGVIIGAYGSPLTVGSYYYLAVGDGGGITTVAPSGGGNLVQKVGLALTTTSLLFNAVFGGS
ncbi:unnamed protein product [Sphagnum tenellum]